MKQSFLTLSILFTVSIALVGCFGSSDIWYAATDDDVSSIERLLKDGIDVDAKDYDGETPLSSAASFGHLKSVRFLLSKGANPNITNDSGDTALLSVGLISDNTEDDIEIIRLLIKAGADIDFEDSNGSTALHSAVFFGRAYLVKALLDNGENTEIKDKYNETPILSLCTIAKEKDAKEIFNLLP